MANLFYFEKEVFISFTKNLSATSVRFLKHSGILITLLCIVLCSLVHQSCTKMDLKESDLEPSTGSTGRFFEMPNTTNPTVARVAAFMKDKYQSSAIVNINT